MAEISYTPPAPTSLPPTAGTAFIPPFAPLDCSGNPNYPATTAGQAYEVSVAGRIGGASGPEVFVGDTIWCEITSASGNHATVGANFKITRNRASPTLLTDINCSGNPNYPAGVKGDRLRVSVAGRIGGAFGDIVEVGDIVECITTTAGFSGAAWNITDKNRISATQSLNGYVILATQAQVSPIFSEPNLGVNADVAIAPIGLRYMVDFQQQQTTLTGAGTPPTLTITTTIMVVQAMLAGGSASVQFPTISTYRRGQTVEIYIGDTPGGGADVTLLPAGGQTINGAASVLMSTLTALTIGKSIKVRHNGGTNWIAG